MTMECERNFAGIANSVENADGHALQYFMSNSLWSGQGVFEQILEKMIEVVGLHTGSVLILDEYADEKAGEQSAGALPQYNGRLRKVDLCQLAVALGSYRLLGGEKWLEQITYLACPGYLSHPLAILRY
jgi:SRSO17 transposase